MLGTVFDQGVYQHRVDQINKFYNPNAKQDLEGDGISIGFISDSYGDSTADVNNFDLPGSPSNPVNKQPVVVLQDLPGTNEGRGMVQIGYKMAPKARLGFATANGGEVNFANNIRALASGFWLRTLFVMTSATRTSHFSRTVLSVRRSMKCMRPG